MRASNAAAIWSALPVPGFLVGKDNQITDINPAAEMFLNAPLKALIGKPFIEALSLNIEVAQSLARARDGHSALFHRDVGIEDGQGRVMICDVQIAPLQDEAATMLILLQPRQIAGQLGRALQVKQTAQAAIGMADMLAHEIKNPLAGISGAAQLLAMNLGREDQEMIGLILQETKRIVELLKQVEQFGDIRKPILKPLNIHDILERSRMSAAVGVASNMQFFDQYDPSLPAVPGDGDQLMQVFSNLFGNAAEAAADAGGTITIRTFFEPGLRLKLPNGEGLALPLHIEIIDDGPGIPAAMLEQVFDPFVSGRENGTWLGLALVSKIVTDHNGAISVKSAAGKTVFRISLPIYQTKKGTR